MKKGGMDRNITFVIGVILLLCLTVFLVSYNENQNLTGNSIFDIFKSKKTTVQAEKSPAPNVNVEDKFSEESKKTIVKEVPVTNAQAEKSPAPNVNAESDRFSKETQANEYLTSIGCECTASGLSCIANGETQCDDGIDNDKDGLIDCQDNIDCNGQITARDVIVKRIMKANDNTETMLDDSLHRFRHWENQFIAYDYVIPTVTCSRRENEGFSCEDKIDNDGDGLIDCADRDCNGILGGVTSGRQTFSSSDKQAFWEDLGLECPDTWGATLIISCEITIESLSQKAYCYLTENQIAGKSCQDDFDNDGDGLIDYDDPDCGNELVNAKESTCCDDLDNDKDGLNDCDDPDCLAIRGLCLSDHSGYVEERNQFIFSAKWYGFC